MASQSTETLRSRYVEQAASDLAENRRRQQELTDSIAQLKQEEALLTDILSLTERFPGPRPATASDAGSDAGADAGADGETPAPAAPRTRPKTPARTKAAPSSPATGRKRRGKKTAATAHTPRPLLGELLTGLLAQYEEPRLAKELRAELLEKHPDRTPTPQVVRNTLESLVAKGRIQRHKQQRSVMYTLIAQETA
ncbi:hypothetical protein GTW43_06430 [Streptomyces sp. SID5785]|uniref:hypothetical protein n=1 Tax=Streptomyces sp. SID5785 TaxID=2690309 RepID=UPI00136187D7|nr:hypothetical protein [Streptomyces sp. SID5785]MZD04722.1 hypothetical protein [Streptomyces sp. SID5785]